MGEVHAEQQQSAVSPRLRGGTPADLPFIASTWLRHYRRRCAAAAATPEQTYLVEQRALIQTLLARSAVTVACDGEDPTLILGYVVSSDRAIHWLQVKAVFRGHGVARLLAASVPGALYWSHDTDTAARLWASLGLRLSYNPDRAWSGL
jgi:hypothetical protein